MNSTEDDLLAAILAEPADDVPRYALADLWEEKGDPRGEFVRVQLRLAELGDDGSPIAHDIDGRCVCELCAPRKREAQLLEEQYYLWGVEDRLPGGRIYFNFRRGLVSRVVCPFLFWLDSGADLLGKFPIAEVMLTTPPPLAADQNPREHTTRFRLTGVPVTKDYVVPHRDLALLRHESFIDLHEQIACGCLKNWLPGRGVAGIRYSLERGAARQLAFGMMRLAGLR